MEKQPQTTPPISIQLQTEMSVYYGSQTGTASGFAKTLADEAVQYGVKAKVVDLATFDPSVLSKEKLAIFVIATYGRGGPTDNAKKFYQWLVSPAEIKPDSFKSTMFAVFGCGDRGFKFFNKMAKDVTDKLVARGANKIYETGMGDASEDLEGEFATWKTGLWDSIRSHCKTTHDLDKSISIQSDFVATFDEKEIEAIDFSKVEFDLTTKQYIEASKILGGKELTGNYRGL